MPVYMKLGQIAGETSGRSAVDEDSFDFAVEPEVDPIALLLPAVQAARDAAPATCQNNLKQLSLPMHNYDWVVDDRAGDFISEDWAA